jgi:2-polyprenyl-3-methyl-5-hydroxy-6-metoxy-1,4-benzoquinol methylase
VSTRKLRLTYIETHIRPKAGDRILDIGCGPANILEDLPDVEYLGLDIDNKYIDSAIKRFGTRGKFVCMKVSGGAIKESSAFDIVLAKGVVHHLDDDEAIELFRLARAAMKPSGRLVTIDGCYVEGRSKLEYYLLSRDRGRYIRTEEGYYHLASKVFPNVKVNVHHDLLRIPYTHLVMECSL